MPKTLDFTTDLGDSVRMYEDGSASVQAGGTAKALNGIQVEVMREFFEWEKAREEERMNPAFEHGQTWRITYDDGTDIVVNIEVGPTGHIYLVNDYLNVYFGIGTRNNPKGRDGIVSYERVQTA